MEIFESIFLFILGFIGAFFVLAIVAVLWLFVSSLLVEKRFYDEDSKYYRFLLYFSTRIAMILCRVHIKTEGFEKLPDSRMLLVCNHRSNFDPLVTWRVMEKKQLAFVSKPENFNIPVFGRIIRKCCFSEINREDPREAIKTIDRAAKLIKNNVVSIGIYPEGTRSKECVLLPFHNGVFKIAMKAKVPIVVSTVQGTEKIHSNFPFKSTTVILKVIDVISTDELLGKTTKDVGDRVLELMRKDLKEV